MVRRFSHSSPTFLGGQGLDGVVVFLCRKDLESLKSIHLAEFKLSTNFHQKF